MRLRNSILTYMLFTLPFTVNGYELGVNSTMFHSSYFTYNPMTDGYYKYCGYTGGTTDGWCYSSPSRGNLFPYIVDNSLPEALWNSAGQPCTIFARVKSADGGGGGVSSAISTNGWTANWHAGTDHKPRMLGLLERESKDCLGDLQSISRWGFLTGISFVGWTGHNGGHQISSGACFYDVYVRTERNEFYQLTNAYYCTGPVEEGSFPKPKPSPVCDTYGDPVMDFGVIGINTPTRNNVSLSTECDRDATLMVKILPSSSIKSAANGGVTMTLDDGVTVNICLSTPDDDCVGGSTSLKMEGNIMDWEIKGTVIAEPGTGGDYSDNLILYVEYL